MHPLINETTFQGDDTYPAWFGFPDARIDALKECTGSGTSIACFHFPIEDRHAALWNKDMDNDVVMCELDDWEPVWECDYLYLRVNVCYWRVEWCRDNPEYFEEIYTDEWGSLWRIN